MTHWEPENGLTLLSSIYQDLRRDCVGLEEYLEAIEHQPGILTAKEIKRLDKAVTVMKVAFKIIKKVEKQHRCAGQKAA